MKYGILCSSLVSLLFIVLSLTAQAQVSFLQPPLYAGSGNAFVADFNGDGKLDILTADGTLNLGNGDGTFTTGTPVTQPTGPFVLAVADFNGDGKPDVLEQGTGTLLVLLGNGDGTFQAAIPTASGASLAVVAAVDLNGDGKADVVGVFNGTLYVYLSKGDGTFASPKTYILGSTSPNVVPILLVGDFTGDHKMDVAVDMVNSGDSTAQVFILLGNGDGTFQAPQASAGIIGSAAVVGDFNGDGKLDLAISGCVSTSNCAGYILLGNGDGTFQPPTAEFPLALLIAAADVNGDGKLDLVLQTDESEPLVVQVFLGNGTGTFSSASNYVVGLFGSPAGLAIADFNGDGKLDIAVADYDLLGNGDGTFQGFQFSAVPSSQTAGTQVIGDFEKNSTADMAVVSNQSVYILHNNGKGVLSLSQTYALQEPGHAIATGDFNGDGNLDLVVFGTDTSGSGDWSYSVFLGKGDGSFQAPAFYAQSVQTNAQTYSVVVADFNNDQKLDIAVTSGNQTLALLLGKGDGTFSPPSYIYDADAISLVAADFNGDGNFDIAGSVLNSSGAVSTAILYGNGDGTFQAAAFPASLQDFGAGFSADFNNDGKPDLASSTNPSAVALNNGDGTFSVGPNLPGSLKAVADFNGDGKPDLLVTTWYRGFISQTGVMLGKGDGTFGSLVYVPSKGILPATLIVADMNGDGLPDIVFPWGVATSGYGVLLNTTPKPVPDFSITSTSGSSTSQTVSAGQPAKFGLVVTPIAMFSGTVNLSCTITPAVTPAPTCGLSSATLQIVNGTAQPVTLNVSTVAPITTGAVPNVLFPPGAMPLLWTVMLVGSACLWVRTRKRLPALVAPAMVLLLASLVSCSGGGSPSSHTIPGTPAGTYTATITASSGSVNHSMPLTVVVQ